MLPADVVGVIAAFLPQTTEQQRSLMLVSNTWYRGAMEQDGMKPKPGVFWPWSALKERQPTNVTLGRIEAEHMKQLTALPNLAELRLLHNAVSEGCEHLAELKDLTALHISSTQPMDCDTLPPMFLDTRTIGSLQHLTTIAIKDFKVEDADVEFITLHCQQLTSLNISLLSPQHTISDDGLKHIATNLGHHLKELDIRGHRQVTDLGLEHLVLSCRHLKSLRLSNNKKLTDAALQLIGGGLQELTALRLHHCPHLTSGGMKHLAKLPHLTEVDVSGCGDINDEAMACFGELKNLKSLNIGQCMKVTDVGVKALSTKELTTLIAYSTCLSDNSLHHISSAFPKLEALHIELCHDVTDAGLGFIATLEHLIELKVSHNSVTSEMLCNSNSKDNNKPCRMRSLEFFGASRSNVSDNAIQQITKYNPHLTTLMLQSCVSLTDSALHSIGNSLFHLKTLNLSLCTSITGDGLMDLVQGCPHITNLNISCCYKITDHKLCAICENLHQLRRLDLSNLGGLTSKGFVGIADHLQQLQFLNISDCELLTNEAVEEVAKLPKLDELTAYRCVGITMDSSRYHKLFSRFTVLNIVV